LVLEVVEKAAEVVVAGLKAERARKAVAEVGRARARAVMVRGADIMAAVKQEWRGEGLERQRGDYTVVVVAAATCD
jgi:hypothetical protein